MVIRQAGEKDLKKIIEIFAEARVTIASLGIDQWQDGYPTREIVEEDLHLGRSYVTETDGKVCATYVLQLGGDSTYDVICGGEWLSGSENRNYLAVHRVAISVCARGRGIAEKLMTYAAEYAKDKGLTSLRIDTHEGNVVMRRMLEKNGFAHCGTIYLLSGASRVAYEKIVR